MNNLSPEMDELWTQEQLCQYLGKSKPWAERGRVEGYGPAFIKIGRSVRYAKKDIIDWLQQNCKETTR